MIISNTETVVTAISAVNECVTFFQWVKSLWSHWNRTENQEDDVPNLQNSLGSHSSGTEQQELKEDDVLKLQSSFQCLRDTLPAMYNFINRVEWRSHEKGVAEFLPEIKAAIYDADNLLEDFRRYELKVKIEGSAASAEPGTRIFHDFIQGNFSKLIHIQQRLLSQYRLLEGMSLHQASPRFDGSVRPDTTSFPTEAKIFGRDDEVKELISMLGVPGPSRLKRKRSAPVTSVPHLPIVGIGGAGKTTVAQIIVHHLQVKKHLDVIVEICISDYLDTMWKPVLFAITSAGTQAATSYHTDVPPMCPPPMSRRHSGQINSDSSILKVLKIVLRMNKDMNNAMHRERQARKRDSKRIKRELKQIKKLKKEAGKQLSPSGSETEELEVESEGEQYPDVAAFLSQVQSEQQYGQSYAQGGGFRYSFGGQFYPGPSPSSAREQHQQFGPRDYFNAANNYFNTANTGSSSLFSIPSGYHFYGGSSPAGSGYGNGGRLSFTDSETSYESEPDSPPPEGKGKAVAVDGRRRRRRTRNDPVGFMAAARRSHPQVDGNPQD